ncbi:MAG: glycine cleavage system aminomethyltransferase GcvT [Cytophagales bacterium]
MKRIPLHDKHVALGAKIVPFAGYEMPVRYSSDLEEHHLIRNNVGLFDVSHMGEFWVEGPNALKLIQYVTSNDASKLTDGKIQYSCLPNGKGGIVDDLLVYRFSEEKYLLVVNASNIDKDWNWISQHNEKFGATMSNVSDYYCLFALQGPKAIEVLKKLSTDTACNLEYYSFTTAKLGTLDKILISATGYTGAGGFEIYVPNNLANGAWDLIIDAGEEFGIQPVGLGARDTLRLEMGYCLYGNDIDDTTSPLEAGLGWITKFNKEFIDKEFLETQKQNGISKKLVGFEMIDRGIPRSHYKVCTADGTQIGEVTSGTQSPTLSKGIGMAYISINFAKLDSEIYIEVRGRYLKAKVVKMPFVSKGI